MLMKKIVIILVTIIAFQAMYAQQDSTLNRTVVVENEYNPTVMRASKVNVLPRVEPPMAVKSQIEYNTQLKELNKWEFEKMVPLVKENDLNKAARGYVKGKFGNRLVSDISAGYLADFHSSRLDVNASFNGWNGKVDQDEEKWTSRYYNTHLNMLYQQQIKEFAVELGGMFQNEVFNYKPVSWPLPTDRQRLNLGNIHVALGSESQKLPLQFSIGTGVTFFKKKHNLFYENTNGPSETRIHTTADVHTKFLEDRIIGLNITVDNLLYSFVSPYSHYTPSAHAIHANPYILLELENTKIRLGANVDWGKDEESAINFSPNLMLDYTFDDSYVAYLYADGGRQQNDMIYLHQVSPYNVGSQGIEPSTYHTIDALVGVKGSPMVGLWFNLFGGYQIKRNELFLNVGGRDVYNIFANSNVARVGGEVKYDFKDLFAFQLKGVYYNWNNETLPIYESSRSNIESYGGLKPKFEFDCLFSGKPINKLSVNAGCNYILRCINTATHVKNVYAGASYQLIRNLNIDLKADNLLNQYYLTNQGYPALGITAMMGASYRF